MTGSAMLHTPADVGREAAAVLAEISLAVSKAIGLMLRRVAADKMLPFEPLVPNAETVAAMQEARAGGAKRFDTVADLMADLDAND